MFRPFKTTDKDCSFDCTKKRIVAESQEKAARAAAKQKAGLSIPKKSSKKKAISIKQRAQIAFNSKAKARDVFKPCISCGAPYHPSFEAGHLFSVGAYPELRFNELNVNGQCWDCNNVLGGNAKGYKVGLAKRYNLNVEDITPLFLAELAPENNGLKPKEILIKYGVRKAC